MGALAFVIPTRGRARQLSAAVRSIAEQIGSADVRVVVIYNKGEADTERALTRARTRWPQVVGVGVDGEPDYADKFRAMMRAEPDSEWVWTFGDDDILQPGALKFMLGRLAKADPALSFIHVSERKRSTGSGNVINGRLIDLACSIGWLEMTGFISCNLTRGRLLAQCAESKNWDAYATCSYVQSCALLERLKNDAAQFMDLPLVECQEEQVSAQTLVEWEMNRTGERYLYIAHALREMAEQGIVPRKLPPKFFRYTHYHLWDRHITYFISNVMNGAYWAPQWADQVKILADMVDDDYVANGIRYDVDQVVKLAEERFRAMREAELRSESMRLIYEARSRQVYSPQYQGVVARDAVTELDDKLKEAALA